MYTETFDQSINDKHVKTHSEALDGRGSSKDSDSNLEVIYESGSSMASNGQIVNGTGSISLRVSRSNSSSSSESSADDILQVDTPKVTNSGESIPGFEDKQNDVSSESSTKSEVDSSSSLPMSKSQVYNVTHGEHQMGMSPTSTPPVQVMDRSAGCDPYRIPSSVFARNTNPVGWSIDSNESLFSIRLGNRCVSRGHESLFSEVSNLEEFTESGESNVSSQIPSVIVEETDSPRKIVEKEDMQTTYRSDEAFKIEERISEAQYKVKNSPSVVSCNTSNVSGSSNGSGTSAHGFASPIKKRAWSLCCCSGCCSSFCYYTWSSCNSSNCSWVFCSNCSCVFCYCWYFNHKRCCCLASPILTEAETISPVKTDIPRQQSIKKISEMAPSSTSTFFNCFQCFSWSCCTWGNCCRCSAWGNWFQCLSWSCCTWGNYCRCCTWDTCCRTRGNCCC